MQAQQVRAAALQQGRALGDAALDGVAAAVQADKEEAGWQEEEGKLETNETQAFIDSLSAQALPGPEPSAPLVKVCHCPYLPRGRHDGQSPSCVPCGCCPFCTGQQCWLCLTQAF